MLPGGADAVIPYEEVEHENQRIRLLEGGSVKPGQCIHREGSDCAQGD